jgi:hypothetical protein
VSLCSGVYALCDVCVCVCVRVSDPLVFCGMVVEVALFCVCECCPVLVKTARVLRLRAQAAESLEDQAKERCTPAHNKVFTAEITTLLCLRSLMTRGTTWIPKGLVPREKRSVHAFFVLVDAPGRAVPGAAIRGPPAPPRVSVLPKDSRGHNRCSPGVCVAGGGTPGGAPWRWGKLSSVWPGRSESRRCARTGSLSSDRSQSRLCLLCHAQCDPGAHAGPVLGHGGRGRAGRGGLGA